MLAAIMTPGDVQPPLTVGCWASSNVNFEPRRFCLSSSSAVGPDRTTGSSPLVSEHKSMLHFKAGRPLCVCESSSVCLVADVCLLLWKRWLCCFCVNMSASSSCSRLFAAAKLRVGFLAGALRCYRAIVYMVGINRVLQFDWHISLDVTIGLKDCLQAWVSCWGFYSLLALRMQTCSYYLAH